MISIIIATFKRHQYIKQTIDSILSQSYRDFEIIVVPVYGDDEDIEAVKSYNDPRIRIVIANYACITYQKTLGFYSASKDSDYMMCFDSDDIMMEDSLLPMYEFAVKHNADLVYPNFFRVDKNLKKQILKKFIKHEHKKLLKGCYITDVSMVRKEIYDIYLPLLNTDRKNRFYRVWKQMSLAKRRMLHYPHPTFLYRQHRKNIHGKKYGSQKDFKFVCVGGNRQINKFYKNIKSISVSDVDDNHFTIYFPDPSKYVRNEKYFKFKKIVIHWDNSNISSIDHFVDKYNIYNITHNDEVLEILKNKSLSNVSFIKDKNDLLDYLKEERY